MKDHLLRKARFLSVGVSLGLLTLSAFAFGQEWSDLGRVTGEVYEAGGEPIAGAEIEIRSKSSGQGVRIVLADEQGHWAVAGIEPGAWEVVIRAAGFSSVQGILQAEVGLSPPLRTVLRSLQEVSPSRSEGNPRTVRKWLQKGNSLLEQGLPAAARVEYEKAIRVLAPEEQPAVLRAVARTHFLEQNGDLAWQTLRLALVYGPEDPETRDLFSALSANLGRDEESVIWLQRIEKEKRSALLEELGVSAPRDERSDSWTPPESESRKSLAHQTGRFRTRFEERSPWSRPGIVTERNGIGDEDLGPEGLAYDLSEESFELYVPPSYSKDRPAGLFVWVSPIPWGGFTREGIREVLDRQGVIWIGANSSGNERLKWDRIGLALDGAHGVLERYAIDPRRVWVGGYSGGGRTATALAVLFPEVFQGGFFFMGVDFFKNVPALDRPGAIWPSAFPPPKGKNLELTRDRNHYVFMTGELDFNRIQTREFFARFREEGFRHVTLVDIPGLSHYSGFDGVMLEQGLEALKGGS